MRMWMRNQKLESQQHLVNIVNCPGDEAGGEGMAKRSSEVTMEWNRVSITQLQLI